MVDRSAWRIDEVAKATVTPLVTGNHYLHRMPAVVPCSLSLTVDGWVKGALVWAIPPKETEQRYGCETWELARLWLADELPHNSESWFIGRAIKHVRQKHPSVGALVSYADPSAGHIGTIYKATNWHYEGMTDSERSVPRWDYYLGNRRVGRATRGNVTKRRRQPKHRYSMLLTRSADGVD